MNSKQIITLAALSALCGCQMPPAAAPAGSHPNVVVTNNGSLVTVNNTLAAASGQTIRLSFMHDLQNPDCTTSDQRPLLNIVTQPSHGTLTQRQVQDFPGYPANSPLIKCSTTRVPGTLLLYTPQPGYSGADQLSYQIFTSHGQEYLLNSTINVAP